MDLPVPSGPRSGVSGLMSRWVGGTGLTKSTKFVGLPSDLTYSAKGPVVSLEARQPQPPSHPPTHTCAHRTPPIHAWFAYRNRNSNFWSQKNDGGTTIPCLDSGDLQMTTSCSRFPHVQARVIPGESPPPLDRSPVI